jgi:hypothetical protein
MIFTMDIGLATHDLAHLGHPGSIIHRQHDMQHYLVERLTDPDFPIATSICLQQRTVTPISLRTSYDCASTAHFIFISAQEVRVV